MNSTGTLQVTADTINIEQAIASRNVLSAADVVLAADFIRACLRLDPERRATAAQLLEHPFTIGAAQCANYRPV